MIKCFSSDHRLTPCPDDQAAIRDRSWEIRLGQTADILGGVLDHREDNDDEAAAGRPKQHNDGQRDQSCDDMPIIRGTLGAESYL